MTGHEQGGGNGDNLESGRGAGRRTGASPEDRALVERVLAGEREAFRGLVEKYQGLVYTAALRVVKRPEEAEDLAQETFLRAYKNLARYDPRWTMATWLLTIATREALKSLRGQRPAASLDELSEDDDREPALADERAVNPAEATARGEWLARLGREIEALSGRMRVAFGLRYQDQRSIAEIAALTRSSVAAVKVQLHRARLILRERLKDYSDFL